MDGLIVVCTETDFLDSRVFSSQEIEKNRKIFDRIAIAIPDYFVRGDKVYYFSGGSTIYPAIRQFSSRMTIFECDGFEEYQRFDVKKKAIEDGLGLIGICGFSYKESVTGLHGVLIGEWSYLDIDMIQDLSQEEIKNYERKLNAHIIDRLTDKDN